MRSDYRTRLVASGYQDNTIATQLSRIARVEQYYGNLDELIENGKYEDLIKELNYTTLDERHNRPNPSKMKIDGNIRNSLQSYKNSVVLYKNFTSSNDEIAAPAALPSSAEAPTDGASEQQRLSLERDMQIALRRNIELLERGLAIVDEGIERGVASGFIDILCRDEAGTLVVVELKAGKSDARVIGQTLGYMGDLGDEERVPVRGIIVAHEFDQRTRSAAKAVETLELHRYTVSFRFEREV